jgi:glutamyl/glutaminyl-tRNA synthetase
MGKDMEWCGIKWYKKEEYGLTIVVWGGIYFHLLEQYGAKWYDIGCTI